MKEIIFPTTADEFIVNQERLIGRQINTDERKITAMYVEIVNDVYQEATSGETSLFSEAVKIARTAIRKHAKNESLTRFMSAFIVWLDEAREQGRQDAQTAVRA